MRVSVTNFSLYSLLHVNLKQKNCLFIWKLHLLAGCLCVCFYLSKCERFSSSFPFTAKRFSKKLLSHAATDSVRSRRDCLYECVCVCRREPWEQLRLQTSSFKNVSRAKRCVHVFVHLLKGKRRLADSRRRLEFDVFRFAEEMKRGVCNKAKLSFVRLD